MTNKVAAEICKELWRYEKTDKYNEFQIREALDLAIIALEGQELDIKALKRDLPEMFKPEYDGGYLLEGVEE